MNAKELWSLGPNDLVIPRRTDRTHSFPTEMKLAIDKPARVKAAGLSYSDSHIDGTTLGWNYALKRGQKWMRKQLMCLEIGEPNASILLVSATMIKMVSAGIMAFGAMKCGASTPKNVTSSQETQWSFLSGIQEIQGCCINQLYKWHGSWCSSWNSILM